MTVPILAARESLVSFATKLGLTEDILCQTETPDQLSYFNEELAAAGLASLEMGDVQDVIQNLGDSFSGSVRIGDLPILEFSSNLDEATLSKFRDQIAGHQSVTMEFAVDKSRLVSAWGLDQVERRVVTPFFFAEQFKRLLQKSLSNPSLLETAIWNGVDSGRSIVVLADHSVFVDGPMVGIVGNDHIAALESMSGVSPEVLESVKKEYSACRNAVRWETEWMAFLTPRHFDLNLKASPTDPFCKLLSALAANVGVLFTADRVRQLDDKMVATYATDHLRSDVVGITTTDVDEAFSCEAAVAISEIALWAYNERWQPDRVRMVQVSIARSLVGTQPRPAADLLSRASSIRDDLHWHWKTFISEEVDRYISEERDLENEVAETVDVYESQVAEMIKSLSGTMLAAVGVLIGSFIAAAFKDKFNDTVFVIGIVSYMVYLAAFPGIYNMTHHVVRFRAHDAIFNKRRSRFAKILGDDLTDQVVDDDVKNAKTRFWRWFKFTVAALGFVLVLSGFAAFRVPELFAN